MKYNDFIKSYNENIIDNSKTLENKTEVFFCHWHSISRKRTEICLQQHFLTALSIIKIEKHILLVQVESVPNNRVGRYVSKTTLYSKIIENSHTSLVKITASEVFNCSSECFYGKKRFLIAANDYETFQILFEKLNFTVSSRMNGIFFSDDQTIHKLRFKILSNFGFEGYGLEGYWVYEN